MQITSADNIVIEITRRCNMCCAHCLRGDAENVDIDNKYINAFFNTFEEGAFIGTITFTGGEISLNIPAIRYILEVVKKRGISVGSFYMVTNGKDSSKMPDLAMASLEWWNFCEDKDDTMCGLCISSDAFHEKIPCESESILSGLKYNRNDKVTDFHQYYLLNEGRAKQLDSTEFKKREPVAGEITVTHEDNNGEENDNSVCFSGSELYLNAIGDVVVGCDWSYLSQLSHKLGNVMDEKWLDSISDSEFCIVE